MSCWQINEYAGVQFGQVCVIVGLPDGPNSDVIETITARAKSAGATNVWPLGLWFEDEFLDRDKKRPNPFYQGHPRELRIFGELYNKDFPNIQSDFLAIQAEFGTPDPEYKEKVRQATR